MSRNLALEACALLICHCLLCRLWQLSISLLFVICTMPPVSQRQLGPIAPHMVHDRIHGIPQLSESLLYIGDLGHIT